MKLNAALTRLPTFTAAPSDVEPHRAMVTITPGLDAAPGGVRGGRRGEPRRRASAELYFQTAYDPTVAPPGHHVMSVFAQYAPYELAEGGWDARRDEIADADPRRDRRATRPTSTTASPTTQVLGPPDIEERIGLTGGHIFQGAGAAGRRCGTGASRPRTPVDGLYLCGAATHPGGSVIALTAATRRWRCSRAP